MRYQIAACIARYGVFNRPSGTTRSVIYVCAREKLGFRARELTKDVENCVDSCHIYRVVECANLHWHHWQLL